MKTTRPSSCLLPPWDWLIFSSLSPLFILVLFPLVFPQVRHIPHRRVQTEEGRNIWLGRRHYEVTQNVLKRGSSNNIPSTRFLEEWIATRMFSRTELFILCWVLIGYVFFFKSILNLITFFFLTYMVNWYSS